MSSNTIHKDVLPLIFEYTHDADDLKRISLVCKRWRDATNKVCLNILRTFGINRIEYGARKQVVATVHFLSKILNSDPQNKTLVKIRGCLPETFSSILDIRNIGDAFAENCLKCLKIILIAIEKTCPSATTLKAILINRFGTLLLATQYNSLASLRFHLNKGAPTKFKIQRSLLPACQKGNYKMAKLLLEKGADPKEKRLTGKAETYLTAASKCNNFILVKLLITKGAHTRERNNKGLIPLAIAARVNFKMFQLLAKISATLSDTYGVHKENTLAHFAAKGNKPGVIRLMVSSNAPIDRPNLQGITPLMVAIESGSLDAFFELLECGASILTECEKHWTALDYAVVHDKQRCIDFLLDQETNRTLRLNSLKLAASYKNMKAVKKISTSLGITPVVKYGSMLALGALIGGLAVITFFTDPQE